MKRSYPWSLVPIVALLLSLIPRPPAAHSQEAADAQARPAEGQQVDMAAMMVRAKQYTTPGEEHRLLERFLGSWDTATRITMAGMGQDAEKGTATFQWLMEGRWLQGSARGTIMGMAFETFLLMGYDKLKMSYVTAMVNSLDTALVTSEGDLDPGGEVLLAYGTLDEYLTGEHDKMVKYVWRFLSDDEILLEVHDLPIGEKNTQVLEIRYTRAKGEPS